MTTAVYAFSGDPITYGHVDVIKRASKAFSKVIVAIGVNPHKTYTFTTVEREEMAKRALAHISNVEVDSFTGLLVDYAYSNNIPVIIRGVRNIMDVVGENELFYINLSQNKDIDTFYLPAGSSTFHISSSAAKALQKEQGIIREYVPPYVKMKLEWAINKLRIVGITGEIGCGKSWLGENLVKIAGKKGKEAHNIELDHIGHQILDDTSPLGLRIHRELLKAFEGMDILHDNRQQIDRKKLGDIVFNDPIMLKELNRILHEPMLHKLRKSLYGKNGWVFINAALIAESGLSYICNNNVIVVSNKHQMKALKGRDLTEDQITKRLNCQYTNKQKIDVIKAEIEKTKVGSIRTFDSWDTDVKKFFDTLEAFDNDYR